MTKQSSTNHSTLDSGREPDTRAALPSRVGLTQQTSAAAVEDEGARYLEGRRQSASCEICHGTLATAPCDDGGGPGIAQLSLSDTGALRKQNLAQFTCGMINVDT